MSLHRILGAEAPPWTQAVSDDGDPSIVTLAMFYTGVGVTGRSCVGGRVHVPNDVRVNSKAVTISAWSTPAETPVELANAPDRSWSGTTPPAGGWVSGVWDPLPFDDTNWIGIGVFFDGAPDCYLFTGASQVGTGFVQSPTAQLYLAETAINGGRGRFRIGAGGTGSTTAWYGLDITVFDGTFTANRNGQEGELWVQADDGPRRVYDAVKT